MTPWWACIGCRPRLLVSFAPDFGPVVVEARHEWTTRCRGRVEVLDVDAWRTAPARPGPGSPPDRCSAPAGSTPERRTRRLSSNKE